MGSFQTAMAISERRMPRTAQSGVKSLKMTCSPVAGGSLYDRNTEFIPNTLRMEDFFAKSINFINSTICKATLPKMRSGGDRECAQLLDWEIGKETDGGKQNGLIDLGVPALQGQQSVSKLSVPRNEIECCIKSPKKYLKTN